MGQVCCGVCSSFFVDRCIGQSMGQPNFLVEHLKHSCTYQITQSILFAPHWVVPSNLVWIADIPCAHLQQFQQTIVSITYKHFKCLKICSHWSNSWDLSYFTAFQCSHIKVNDASAMVISVPRCSVSYAIKKLQLLMMARVNTMSFPDVESCNIWLLKSETNAAKYSTEWFVWC